MNSSSEATKCHTVPIGVRGIVEDFFGTPWSHEARMDMLKFYQYASIYKNRFKNIEEELRVFGQGADPFLGAAGYKEPKDWKTAYRSNYKKEPPFLQAKFKYSNH